MKERLHIVKMGGASINSVSERHDALRNFSNLDGKKILVHGGGAQADELMSSLGIKPRKVDGRRITDDKSLEVVTMVYAGLLNTQIISELHSLGCQSVGISGADAGIVLCRKRPVKEIDYGKVGDIEAIRTDRLNEILELGIVPVFSAITSDSSGQLLNTNADTIAAELAISMSREYETKLWYQFDKPGVLGDPNDPESIIEKLTPDNFRSFKTSGVITAGMIPKLEMSFRAVSEGVGEVLLGAWSGSGKIHGTSIMSQSHDSK